MTTTYVIKISLLILLVPLTLRSGNPFYPETASLSPGIGSIRQLQNNNLVTYNVMLRKIIIDDRALSDLTGLDTIGLESYQELILTNNHLTTASLYQLPQCPSNLLTYINLSGNRLTELPGRLLDQLQLAFCRLRTLQATNNNLSRPNKDDICRWNQLQFYTFHIIIDPINPPSQATSITPTVPRSSFVPRLGYDFVPNSQPSSDDSDATRLHSSDSDLDGPSSDMEIEPSDSSTITGLIRSATIVPLDHNAQSPTWPRSLAHEYNYFGYDYHAADNPSDPDQEEGYSSVNGSLYSSDSDDYYQQEAINQSYHVLTTDDVLD